MFRDADIVCSSEALTDIAKTPFCQRDGWRMVAVRRNGVIYIHDCAVNDGIKLDFNRSLSRPSIEFRFGPPRDTTDAHLSYWGNKFDKVMTSKNPDLAKLVSISLNNCWLI